MDSEQYYFHIGYAAYYRLHGDERMMQAHLNTARRIQAEDAVPPPSWCDREAPFTYDRQP